MNKLKEKNSKKQLPEIHEQKSTIVPAETELISEIKSLDPKELLPESTPTTTPKPIPKSTQNLPEALKSSTEATKESNCANIKKELYVTYLYDDGEPHTYFDILLHYFKKFFYFYTCYPSITYDFIIKLESCGISRSIINNFSSIQLLQQNDKCFTYQAAIKLFSQQSNFLFFGGRKHSLNKRRRKVHTNFKNVGFLHRKNKSRRARPRY